MKIVLKNLKIPTHLVNFDTPLTISRDLINQIFPFLTGVNSGVEGEIVYKGQSTKALNYLEFLKSTTSLNITKEQLAEYIIQTNESSPKLEEFIENKSIKISQVVAPLSIENRYDSMLRSMTPEESITFSKIADILVKIKKIDKEISEYQNQKTDKEDLANQLKDKEAIKQKQEQKLASVGSFLERRAEVEKEVLSKKSNVTQLPDILKIKEERINSRNNSFVNGFRSERRNMFEEEAEVDKFGLERIVIPAIVFIQVMFFAIYLVIKTNIANFAINLLLFITLLLLWIFISKRQNDPLKTIKLKTNMLISEGLDAQNNLNLNQAAILSEDNMIINIAYLNALNSEIQNIDREISTALDSQPYSDVKSTYEILVKEIEELNDRINNPKANAMNVDDYYKKRRELDILKIEKDNLEFSSPNIVKPEDDYISYLVLEESNKSPDLTDTKLLLPIILVSKEKIFDEFIERYKNVRQVIVLYET